MKKFLRKFALYGFPVLISLIGLEIWLRHIPTSYSEKNRGLQNGKTEILILGNSHMTYGVDPTRFSRDAYNAANVAQSLYFDKRITLKHLDHLPELKYVIIGIDFHSLSFSSQKNRDIWSYLGYGIAYKDSLPFSSRISYFSALTPKVALTFFKRSMSGKYDIVRAVDLDEGVDLSRPMEKGRLSYPGTNKGVLFSQVRQRNRADGFGNTVRKTKERQAILADLDDFILQLKNRGIQTIFITTPCYEPYVKMLDAELMRQNRSEINAMAKKYGIPYWNYLNLHLPDHYFYDYDHLNEQGAKVFSDTLNTRLIKEFPRAR